MIDRTQQTTANHRPHQPRTWNELAPVIARLVDADDPRLQDLVTGLEQETGCGLGIADRSAPMMGRRFARAHRGATSELLPPGLQLVLSDR